MTALKKLAVGLVRNCDGTKRMTLLVLIRQVQARILEITRRKSVRGGISPREALKWIVRSIAVGGRVYWD